MNESNTLARRQAPAATAISSATVADITGYSLAEIALIRHNMAMSLRSSVEDVPMLDVAMFSKACKSLGLHRPVAYFFEEAATLSDEFAPA